MEEPIEELSSSPISTTELITPESPSRKRLTQKNEEVEIMDITDDDSEDNIDMSKENVIPAEEAEELDNEEEDGEEDSEEDDISEREGNKTEAADKEVELEPEEEEEEEEEVEISTSRILKVKLGTKGNEPIEVDFEEEIAKLSGVEKIEKPTEPEEIIQEEEPIPIEPIVKPFLDNLVDKYNKKENEKQITNKVKRKHNYDKEDSFIDDSELRDSNAPPVTQTQISGFFINKGQLVVTSKTNESPKKKNTNYKRKCKS